MDSIFIMFIFFKDKNPILSFFFDLTGRFSGPAAGLNPEP